MKFSDYEFFPGVITKVDDPKYIGRIKATVPTIFDSSMNEDGLPWIYPFTMIGGHQGFSKMREGSKVWVIRNTKNRNEFWYVPMFELTESTSELVKEDNYDDATVLISRDNGGGSVYVYYNQTDGMMIKYGDNNMININPESQITIQAGDAKVLLKDNHVYIGDGKDGEPAVLGDQLKDLLSTFFNNLQTAAGSATLIHGAKPYATAVTNAASIAKASLDKILCQNTNVD